MAFERSKVPAPASGVKGGAGRLQTGACCAEIGRLWDLLEDAFGPRASRRCAWTLWSPRWGSKKARCWFRFYPVMTLWSTPALWI